MSDVMIEARELTKRYGDVTALHRASFEVKKGEVVGFLGPNGAGKTTTMKILTGFIAPTEGTAVVNGHDVFEDPLGARRSLGYLPETNPLYVEMLTLEFLQWVARMRGLKGEDGRRRIKKVVEQTALEAVVAKEIRALSKGFRQRVGLAAALMHEPPILILDEPMNGLDPNQAVEIRELIKGIGKERTVILSTHNLFEVQLTCDRVLIVSSGRIVADDRPDDLRARAGKPRYLVAIAENGKSSEAAQKALAAVKGVGKVRPVVGSPTREMHFEVLADTNDDLRAVIYEAVSGADLPLLELGRMHVDLEAVFKDLTLEGPEATPSPAKKKKSAVEAKKRAAEKKAAEDEKKKRAEADEEDEEDDDEEAAEESGTEESASEAEGDDDDDDSDDSDDEKEDA